MAAIKKSIAKSAQRYNPKPVWAECRNCQDCDPNTVTRGEGSVIPWTEDNPVCRLGGFRVKKTGTCQQYKPKER